MSDSRNPFFTSEAPARALYLIFLFAGIFGLWHLAKWIEGWLGLWPFAALAVFSIIGGFLSDRAWRRKQKQQDQAGHLPEK